MKDNINMQIKLTIHSATLSLRAYHFTCKFLTCNLFPALFMVYIFKYVTEPSSLISSIMNTLNEY